MRRRMLSNIEGIKISYSSVGDICLYNKISQKLILIKPTDLLEENYPMTNYSFVGIVVIPSSDNVYGTGELSIMSMKNMDCSNPGYGTTYNYGCYLGPYEVEDIGEVYYNTEEKALTDFDGKGNTEKMIKHATYQSDWKTADEILNSGSYDYTYGYYPAACCCWRYHTDGTKQGDWYIPSFGELNYLKTNYDTIKNTQGIIQEEYGNVCVWFGYTSTVQYSDYWTSTAYDERNSYKLDLKPLNFAYYSKFGSNCVFAFYRFK